MEHHNKRWDGKMDGDLARTVLDYTREGRSLTEAYLAASDIVGKTSVACGYRWGNILSSKFTTEMQEAKEEWKLTSLKVSVKPKLKSSVVLNDSDLTFDQVIDRVSSFKDIYITQAQRIAELELQVKSFEEAQINTKRRMLDLEQTEQDFKEIMRVLNNARAFSLGEPVKEKGKTYKMDNDGILGRVGE